MFWQFLSPQMKMSAISGSLTRFSQLIKMLLTFVFFL